MCILLVSSYIRISFSFFFFFFAGYSSWGGGSSGNRGSGGFDMYGGGAGGSYKDSGAGGYGGGGSGGGHMKRGPSGGSMLSSSGTHADAVIAKINQRLDMLTQLEGGFRGPRGDRFDEYESFDSRPSGLSSSRDLYRSGGGSYGFGDSMLMSQRGGSGFGGGIGLGGGGGFDSPSSSSYGVAKMRPNMRDSFAGGQGAGRRSPRRGGSAGARGAAGGFGGRRSDPTPLSGGLRGSGGGGQSHRGHSPGGGRGKLPSLLSNRMYPESGGFQGSAPGPQDFPGRHFGGGPRGGRQRGRKRPLIKQQMKPQRDGQKKRKTGGDEPESKMNKTEDEEAEGTQGNSSEIPDMMMTRFREVFAVLSHLSGQEKQQKARKRRGFMDRLMFACSVCKFRSFYKEEMDAHLESRFHKDHFKFLSNQLSKPTTDFLQEYMQNKFKKTAERVGQLENHSATICQIYREQDLTRELGMEHFMRKVEAAHCGACDLFIPMQPHLIQKHIKSPDHNYNRKVLVSHLDSKLFFLELQWKLENILKNILSRCQGENPFTGNQDEHDPEDSMAMDVSELEQTGEAAEGQPENPELKDESVAEGEAAQKGEGEQPPAAAAAAAAAATGEEENRMGEEEERMEDEEQQQQQLEEENQEEETQENHGAEEGFEIGEEEEDEGYVVHDEGEEVFHGDEEGAEEYQE
uniref:C2H2 AKAP95-type domain-containing protein n=1 Tax=Poecilia mexicana TaxID=48701 RepID=A0A3B3XI42_9TELE